MSPLPCSEDGDIISSGWGPNHNAGSPPLGIRACLSKDETLSKHVGAQSQNAGMNTKGGMVHFATDSTLGTTAITTL